VQPALQRAGAWCGIGFLVVLFVLFMIVAGLIPPLSPTSSAEQITQHMIDNKLRIRWGVAIMLVTSASVVPFNAALTLRIRRAEGDRWGILSIT
jgi:ABC-type anion transport system duplicated permease subunit